MDNMIGEMREMMKRKPHSVPTVGTNIKNLHKRIHNRPVYNEWRIKRVSYPGIGKHFIVTINDGSGNCILRQYKLSDEMTEADIEQDISDFLEKEHEQLAKEEQEYKQDLNIIKNRLSRIKNKTVRERIIDRISVVFPEVSDG